MYIRVYFPSGRCYAAQAFDPSVPEWPPHPSRLFSGLVAAAYRSGSGITDQKRAVLEWLESLAAPAIAAPPGDLSRAPVSFVPPGDSVERKGKKGEEKYEHPIHRWRQPRHFPSAIIMGEPVIYYGWDEEPEQGFIKVMDEITAGVTHLGTSHSLVAVAAFPGPMPRSPNLIPDRQGSEFLRVASSGRLRELDEVHAQSSGVRRPTPTCEQVAPYRVVWDSSASDQIPGMGFIPLRINGTMHGADTAAYLGRAVRRAVMSVLGDDAPAAVHGHNGGQHVGWLPLPDVGHRHATGRIVGVGIMLPQELGAEQRQEVLAGIGRVSDLRFPDGRVAQLVHPAPGERVPVVLYRKTWTQPCTSWATVTPVVLDRPPKRLTEERVRRAVAESLVYAGYPEPGDIEVSTFSMFRGAPPAFRVPAAKPRYHATVRFPEPVAGPVIAGRLRYFGVGLFRPIPSLNGSGGPQ